MLIFTAISEDMAKWNGGEGEEGGKGEEGRDEDLEQEEKLGKNYN